MSQWGPASRPVSHRSSSKSPSRDSRPSPAPSQLEQRAHDDSPRDPPPELRGIATTNGEARVQSMQARNLGVHNMLNPSETQTAYVGTPRPLTMAGSEGRESPSSVGSSQLIAGAPPHPFIFRGQPSTATQFSSTNLPPSTLGSASMTFLERDSPTSSRPHPALGGPRRMLTPRSPRAASMGRGPSLRALDTPYAAFVQHAGAGVGPSQQEAPPAPPQAAGPYPTVPSTSGALPSTITTPPRSLSQPVFGRVPQTLQAQEPSQAQTPANREQQTRPPVFSSGTAFVPGLPPGRTLSTSGPTGDGQWSTALMRSIQTGGRGVSVSEGQQFITITPSYGEEIHVPVDIHQASKQADEKRLRNAGASARFRARKKEKDKETQMGMQRLEAQSRELQKRLQELEVERDFYRNERNRLRQYMYQHPASREFAESGPPSPTSTTRSGGSFAAESSPMAAPIHPQPPSSIPSYVSDTSTFERPTRRRRTDPAPALEFTTPSYVAPMQTASLPPIPHPGFAVAASPLSGSSGNPRLPPLRRDQPSASPTSEHATGPSAPPPATQPSGPPSQYPPYSRASYETGWATGPRPPHDFGQR